MDAGRVNMSETMSPADRLAELLKQDAQHDKAMEELIQRNREISALALLTGHYKEARDALGKILKLYPNDQDALERLEKINRISPEEVSQC